MMKNEPPSILGLYILDLWLDWIRDEMKIVDSDSSEDREKIYKYFQKATKDYMCK